MIIRQAWRRWAPRGKPRSSPDSQLFWNCTRVTSRTTSVRGDTAPARIRDSAVQVGRRRRAPGRCGTWRAAARPEARGAGRRRLPPRPAVLAGPAGGCQGARRPWPPPRARPRPTAAYLKVASGGGAARARAEGPVGRRRAARGCQARGLGAAQRRRRAGLAAARAAVATARAAAAAPLVLPALGPALGVGRAHGGRVGGQGGRGAGAGPRAAAEGGEGGEAEAAAGRSGRPQAGGAARGRLRAGRAGRAGIAGRPLGGSNGESTGPGAAADQS